MRVVVTGGRFYADKTYLESELSKLGITELAHGGQTGADALAGKWAESVGVPSVCFLADWATYGRPAGPIRNRRMLVEFKPDLVVAFKGNNGTENCVKQARHLGVPVLDKRANTQ